MSDSRSLLRQGERWWRVKAEGLPDWVADESDAEMARRGGHEVHGPYVLAQEAVQALGAINTAFETWRFGGQTDDQFDALARTIRDGFGLAASGGSRHA